MESIADYNNNPGNLRPPKGVTYDGQIGVDDKGFAIFEDKNAGRKALIGDIETKIKSGLNTPEKFIDRYTPKSEENPEESRNNYKRWLSQSLGLKDVTDSFPEKSAEKLADAITKFESGSITIPKAASAPNTVAPSGDGGERLPPENVGDIPGMAEKTRDVLGVTGGVAGLGTATTLETAKKVGSLLPNLARTVTGAEINPNQAVSRYSLQRYLNSQIAPNLRLPLSELERVSGAGKIRTMSEVQNALRAIQAVEEQKAAKPIVKMVPGRPGVYEQTGRFTTSTTPGRPGVDLTPYETPARGPIRQAVGRQLTTAAEVGRTVLPSVAKIGVGALGGANMMMQGYDAAEMARKLREKGDPSWIEWARLASKVAATTGGGLSMMPFGLTQALGLGLQAPETVWSGLEGIKEAAEKATPEDVRRMQESVDIMGNPLP